MLACVLCHGLILLIFLLRLLNLHLWTLKTLKPLRTLQTRFPTILKMSPPKTVSDLPDADLPSMNSTPTNDAGESTLVDLDNTAEDHIDQDSSNSTLQDATYSSTTEEQTMELFPETPSSRPSANGCKPIKISQAFISPGKPTAPILITGKPSCEHYPDSDDSPAPKNRTLAVLTKTW